MKSGLSWQVALDENTISKDDEENKLCGEIDNSVIAKTSSGNIIVEGQHKKSNQKVAIKIIPKKDKSTAEIEAVRDLIKLYQIGQHYNVVKLEDYFENRDHFHLCLDLHSD